MKHMTQVLSALIIMIFVFTWFPGLKSQPADNNTVASKPVDNKVAAWDWSSMSITTTPILPGFTGGQNPNHLQKIRITVTASGSLTIDRAELNFSAVAWDPTIQQNGVFYMNSSTGNSPDSVWYIDLGTAYFYKDPMTQEVQEDGYDTKLLVTAGTKVTWNINCYSKTQTPANINSPKYNYTVEGAWYRMGSTERELFDNNINVSFLPLHPMMGDKIVITLTVKGLPANRRVKPMIYEARVHVALNFYDPSQKDVSDLQIDAVPLQPQLGYQKTATIVGGWNYKPGINVNFWVEAWQQTSMRYWHITSSDEKWHYVVSQAGLWHFPPPPNLFDQNVVLITKPAVIQNPDAAISKDAKGNLQPGSTNVTVTVQSKYLDVPLYAAKVDPNNPSNYIPGTMLWYTVYYDDGFGLVNDTGGAKYYPILPSPALTNSTSCTMVIPPMPSRTAQGHVKWYVEVWNITKQRAGVLYSDAHPISADTYGSNDPFMYNIQHSKVNKLTTQTSFVVWVYDDRYQQKYVAGVNVTFLNGTHLNVPISDTQTNVMGWCYPTLPGGNEPLMLNVGDTILIEVNYLMNLGGATNHYQLIKANYTYKIALGKTFKNTTIMKQYTPPNAVHTHYIYYVVVSDIPGNASNIFFKFNWKPADIPPTFATVQAFNEEYLAVGAGTIAMVACLGPVIWMLDKRRKKAEEDEKRVTL